MSRLYRARKELRTLLHEDPRFGEAGRGVARGGAR